MEGLRFLVLGPLEVRDGERAIEIPPGLARTLLALLILHRGPLSVDEAVDALWGERVPATARQAVHNHVFRLRRALGPDAIVSSGDGYVLGEAGVDAVAFERLAAEGRERLRSGDPRAADRALSGALALWRGPAFAGLDTALATQEATRLQELRSGAREDRLEAALALGRHRAAVPELRRLIAEEPLRERPRGLLMLALYRSGRQVQALEAYREWRHTLADELGLEPDPALRELERQILTHDPALRKGAEPLPRLPPRRRIRLAALVAATAAALAVVALTRGGTSQAGAVDALVRVDPTAGRIVGQVRVAGQPAAVAVAGAGVWVAGGDGRLQRFDASRPGTARSVALRTPATALAAGPRALWVASGPTGTAIRVDPATGAVEQRVRTRRGDDGDVYARATPSTLAVTGGRVWADRGLAGVQRVTGDGRRFRDLGARRSSDALAAAAGALWMLSGADRRLYRLDERTLAVTGTVTLGGRPTLLAASARALWAADRRAGRVLRIDPRRLRVTAAAEVGHGLVALAAGGEGVWALGAHELTGLDPTSAVARTRVALPGRATAVAVGAGSVWVTTAAGTAPAGAGRLSPACSRVRSAGGAPDRLIALDLPLAWADTAGISAGIRGQADAVEAVLRRHRFRAGSVSLGLTVCDDSTPQAHYWTPERCIANARAYAADPEVVAIVGPEHSACARLELPVLARAPGGPPAQIGLTTTYLGLTRPGPGTAPGEPERYSAAGFVRLAAPDDAQGVALAQLARHGGARRVAVLHDGTSNGLPVARAAAAAARALGLHPRGIVRWRGRDRGYRDLAAGLGRPDAVVLAGCLCAHGGRLVRDLRAVLGPRVALLASDGFTTLDQLRAAAGAASTGMLVTVSGTDPSLTVERTPGPAPPAVDGNPAEPALAARAAELLVAAIARSDGSRRSVRARLRRGGFDARGDVLDPVLTAYEVTPTGARAARLLAVDPSLLGVVRYAIGSG